MSFVPLSLHFGLLKPAGETLVPGSFGATKSDAYLSCSALRYGPDNSIWIATNVVGLADVTFRVFKAVADYYHAVKSATAKSQELQDELFAISNVTRNIALLLSNTPTGKESVVPDESVTQFRALLEEIRTKIALSAGDIQKRLEWPLTVKENAEYIDRLERFKSTFSLALNVYQRYP